MKIHVGRSHRRGNDTARKGAAIAAHLVEGKTQEEAAERAGVSRETLCQWLRAYRHGRLDLDAFIAEYRARVIPELAQLQAECTSRALEVAPHEKSVLKATLAAKAASEMLSKAAGEADMTIEVVDAEDARKRVLEALQRRRETSEDAPEAVH